MTTGRRWPRRVAWIAAGLVALLALAPFLLPLPPLEGTRPPAELATSGDRFADLEGISVRYRTGGSGTPAFILLHGFGAHSASWDPVFDSLGRAGRVVAIDRVGFGLTERPLEWDGVHPYGDEAQVSLTLALMDHLGIEEAVVVGHSAGGALAVTLALEHPERVGGLVLEAPSPGPGWAGQLRALAATPQGRRLTRFVARRMASRIPSILESAYHDPRRVTRQMIDAYRLPLGAENWDQGLAHFVAAPRESIPLDRLEQLNLPVLVVTGDDDRWVATEDTVGLASRVPGSTLVVVPDCGHVVHEECPDAFQRAVRDWLAP
jgi:pimeloyl-ACP methyl ester carboxylesterase